MKSNAELQRDVIAELAYEPVIDPAQIGVIAKDGVVTLTGTVRSYAEKMAAVEAAGRLQDVRGVVDEMHVEVPCIQHRTDEDLARAVLNTFKWDTAIPDEKIKFRVSHGWITLEGTVHYKQEQRRAEEAIRYLTGMRGITNLIQVKPLEIPPDVKRKIESALRRSAEADAERIAIEVQGNKVILRGTVHSRAERNAVERAASSAAGVSEVEDHLMIVT